MSKIKDVAKKCVLWSMVISLLVGTSAFAEMATRTKTLNMNNAKALIDKAAQAQAIAAVMKGCIGSISGAEASEWLSNIVKTKETVFTRTKWGVSIENTAGAWLEEKIGGKVNDGIIYCKEGGDKIISLFAKTIGLSEKQILCNANNPEQAGLVTVRSYYQDNMYSPISDHGPINNGCSGAVYDGKTYISYNGYDSANFAPYSNEYRGYGYSNGRTYVKILYDTWVIDSINADKNSSKYNPYLVHWDDVENWSNARGYYEILNEFKANCSPALQSESETEAGERMVTIKEISDDGKEQNNVYQYKQNYKTTANITGNANRGCPQMAEVVNNYYPYYRAELEKTFKDQCKLAVKDAWDFEKDKASAIISGEPTTIKATIEGKEETWTNIETDADGNETVPEYTDEEIEDAREFVNLYNNYLIGGVKPLADTSGETWVCNAPPEYSVTTNAYVDPGEEIDDGPAEQTCANSGGAESLGWIVCPALQWMGKAAEEVYGEYVAPALQVKPKLFSSNENEGSMQGWASFRDLANILFVILFLVVIFSQLTGYGIDNYGIKKILPKLIIVAILINLSYYICVMCVDLSNIAGNGLQGLFNGFAKDLTPALNVPGSDAALNADGGADVTILTGVAVLGALAVMVGAIWTNPAVLLSLAVGALGVIVSILFLFILLAMREAAIVVLTVVSPLAFASYMLPNTKSLFDKWLKFWKGLLLLYPIAGLLVGGGDYVSKLLLSSGAEGFMPALTAMIVGVMPIFFIPTVLKSSFAAMGSIGGKLAGLGNKARGWSTGKVKDSDIFKRAQTRMAAGVNRQGQLTGLGKARAKLNSSGVGKFLGADRMHAAQIAAAEKQIGDSESANATLMKSLSKSEMGDQDPKEYYKEKFKKAAEKGDIVGMNSALDAAVSSGAIRDKDLAEMLRNAVNEEGGMSFKDNNQRAAWMRSTFAKYGSGFLAKDFELKQWMRDGGGKIDKNTGKRISLGDYGDYAKAAPIEKAHFNAEDISKMSASSIAGMFKAGSISSGMAKQVLASHGASLAEDKKILLGAIAGGAVLGENESAKSFKEKVEGLKPGQSLNVGGKEFSYEQIQSWTAPRAMKVEISGGAAPAAPAAQTGSLQEGQAVNLRDNVERVTDAGIIIPKR